MKSKSNKTSGVRIVSVSQDHDGQRLDNFLSTQLKGVPGSAVYRMIRTGQVRINGGRCKPRSRIYAGDEVRIPPARVYEPGAPVISDQVCEQVRACIVYQDGDLLIVDKPSGMAVHSGSGLPWGLIDVVRQLFPDEYIELVHRIDRDTSGLLVLARSGQALRHMSKQFREAAVKKHYLCLLDGKLNEAMVCVDAPVGQVLSEGEKRMEADSEGKPAKTVFRILSHFPTCTYADAELFTGRTHQIRVHAQYLGMPLAGDTKYAGKQSLKAWKNRGLKRIFLHAHRLAFKAPSGEQVELSCALPGPLRKVLDNIEGSE